MATHRAPSLPSLLINAAKSGGAQAKDKTKGSAEMDDARAQEPGPKPV